MNLCKDKPDNMPRLDALGLEAVEPTSHSMGRTGSGRRGVSGSMGPPSASASRQASIGLGISSGQPFGNKTVPGFAMGQFSTPKLTSEERYMRSTSLSMGASNAGAQFATNRTNQMVRSSSQGGPGGMQGNKRTRSSRGKARGEQSQFAPGQQGGGGGYSNAQAQPLEPVAPLQLSENRWVAGSTSRRPQQQDQNSPEFVDRKVRALLNKLTMEKFDSISDQIIEWANKSVNEKDGRTLIQVIRLVFEKATDEANWSEMYARLCRKMMEQISPNVQDDGIKNGDGKPITGGQLFRKYLLNRCQEDFERGWSQKEAATAAAASKAAEDNAKMEANEKSKAASGEEVLYSEEYYVAQKAKRQGLGLVKFIGELFKLQMLTERIMHECIKKLLSNVDNPEEEEIESLCKLLTTVGQSLDSSKAKGHMDIYFSRMKELAKSGNVTSRMQFMLLVCFHSWNCLRERWC
jgi:translation initiation factor 4G